ncbi:hypothetical protein WICPIJ_005378 [Wickerhamomyces pijperi]|uniref:Uncharacterized protein n=1 Tax=Wickerhamomyces pijperi TaxID=599730 RepID=A0A9P8Q634_WICPI|nr:hypothetical protein WICPIJ_005378 [Wickerhamomyces pijperi]
MEPSPDLEDCFASQTVCGFLMAFLTNLFHLAICVESTLTASLTDGLAEPKALKTFSGATWKMSPACNVKPGCLMLIPLTVTAPCKMNCLACLIEEANIALNKAKSKRFSKTA